MCIRDSPKAKLYADLGDFSFFRLEMLGGSLNGGFGKAYLIKPAELTAAVPGGLAKAEQGAVDHMNEDHVDAIQLYARHYGRLDGDGWRLSGLDAEGLDLVLGDRAGRIFFHQPLSAADQLRPMLVAMAREARGAVT